MDKVLASVAPGGQIPKTHVSLDAIAPIYNSNMTAQKQQFPEAIIPATQESEAGGSQLQDLPGLQS